MVALVKIVTAEDMKDAGVTFEAGRVQSELGLKMPDPAQTLLGLLERYPPDDTVNLVAKA